MTETMTKYYRIEVKGAGALSLESEIRRTILRHSHLESLASTDMTSSSAAIAEASLIENGVFDVLHSASRKIKGGGLFGKPTYELELVITGTTQELRQVERMLDQMMLLDARKVTTARLHATTVEKRYQQITSNMKMLESAISSQYADTQAQLSAIHTDEYPLSGDGKGVIIATGDLCQVLSLRKLLFEGIGGIPFVKITTSFE